MTLFQSINQSIKPPTEFAALLFFSSPAVGRIRSFRPSIPSSAPVRFAPYLSFRRDLYRRTHARTRRTKISAALVNECEPSAGTSQPVPIPRKNSSRASLAHPIDRSKPIEKPKHRNRSKPIETEKPKPKNRNHRSVFALDQKEEKSPPTSEQTREKSQNLILSPNLTRLSRFCLFRGLGDRRPLPILRNCDSQRNRRSKTDEDDDTYATDR